MLRFATSLILVLSVFPAFGRMVQIVEVVDSNTITVDEHGRRGTVDLAGVLVPPADEALAKEHLRRTIGSGWALIERDPHDPRKAWLYRSPDGLSINGEMIRAAWRNPGTPMIYLGEADPGPRPEVSPSPRPPAPRPAAKPKSRSPRRLRR